MKKVWRQQQQNIRGFGGNDSKLEEGLGATIANMRRFLTRSEKHALRMKYSQWRRLHRHTIHTDMGMSEKNEWKEKEELGVKEKLLCFHIPDVCSAKTSLRRRVMAWERWHWHKCQWTITGQEFILPLGAGAGKQTVGRRLSGDGVLQPSEWRNWCALVVMALVKKSLFLLSTQRIVPMLLNLSFGHFYFSFNRVNPLDGWLIPRNPSVESIWVHGSQVKNQWIRERNSSSF